MDKLTMAHEHAQGLLSKKKTEFYVLKDVVAEAWRYADAMRAEADKRKQQKLEEIREMLKGPNTFVEREGQHFEDEPTIPNQHSSSEWQPDWSQAPEGMSWFAASSNYKGEITGGYFFTKEPLIIENTECSAYGSYGDKHRTISFNYQGDWKHSLRKRPASEYSEAIKTQQNITATAQYRPFMGNGYIDPLKTDDKTCKHELRDLGKYRTCMVCDYIEEVEND